MIPYLFSFINSAILATIGQELEKTSREKTVSYILYAAALFLLCALAGGRDITVGTDTAGYGAFVYETGLISSSFTSFMDTLNASKWDIGILFGVGSYAVIKLFKSQFAYYFFIELLILVPTFHVIKRHSKRYLGVVLLAYCFALFIPSLNLMRQSIAMGFSLLALDFWMGDRRKLAVMALCVAFFFHYTAIIELLLMLIWMVISRKPRKADEKRNRLSDWIQIQLLALFALSVVALLVFPQVAGLFSGIAHLDRLAAYAFHGGSKISTSSLVFTVMVCSGSAFALLNSAPDNRADQLLRTIAIFLSLFFVIASGIDNTITRMAEYGILCTFPLLGITANEKAVGHYKAASIVLIMTACAFRFFICFCYLGFSSAVPYTSSLFGI